MNVFEGITVNVSHVSQIEQHYHDMSKPIEFYISLKKNKINIDYESRHISGFNVALLCSSCRIHFFTHNSQRN